MTLSIPISGHHQGASRFRRFVFGVLVLIVTKHDVYRMLKTVTVFIVKSLKKRSINRLVTYLIIQIHDSARINLLSFRSDFYIL